MDYSPTRTQSLIESLAYSISQSINQSVYLSIYLFAANIYTLKYICKLCGQPQVIPLGCNLLDQGIIIRYHSYALLQ